MRACLHCGADMDGRRPQARYCTGACRAEASRLRQRRSAGRGKAHSAVSRPRRVDMRVPFSRLVAALGEDRARELLTDRQRQALDRRP